MFTRPGDAYPEAVAVRDAVLSGDMRRVVDLLDGLPSAGDRGWVLRAAGGVIDRLRLSGADLDPADRRTITVLRAHSLVQQARRDRERTSVFRTGMVEAEQLLVEVIAADPEHIDAWDLRVATARWLELGPSEVRRRHQKLMALEPHHVPAHREMLQALLPKWWGTWPEAFTFVRDTMAAIPGPSLAPMLIVDAHLDGWLEHGVDYLRQDVVVAEIEEAGKASVLVPELGRPPGWREAHTNLALFFCLVDRKLHAAVHLRAIEDAPVEGLWSYFDQPAEQFRLHSLEVFGSGARR